MEIRNRGEGDGDGVLQVILKKGKKGKFKGK